jgi:mannosylglycerate hydrolase
MTNINNKPYKAFIVPHTHWDREWYQTFQQFRIRLIDLINNLINILKEDSTFSDFTLDGQTIVLEDYLEVYPEKREILKKFVAEGRIHIGPWYVLPDEFLVSPESIVRNLLLGHKIASEFGRVMKVGYIPDPFGHITQMPQILRGFGIDNIIFWRGIDYEQSQGNEFIWQGPDGTELFAVHLPIVGYGNASSLSEEVIPAYKFIKKAIEDLLSRETSKSLLLLNGGDHLEAQPSVPRLVKELNKFFDGIEVKQGNLEEYIDYAKDTARPGLNKVTGEFRSTRGAPVLQSVYSSRMYIKQANEKCENTLENWAEPTASLAWLLGKDYPQNLIWASWKWLLKNHPHDSICGCSIDQVHKEMITRFDWSKQIAQEVINKNLDYLVGKIKINNLKVNELALVAFNPLPYPLDENVEAKVKFPKGINLNSAKVLTTEGEEIPYQLKGYGLDYKTIFNPFEGPKFPEVNYADISFTAKGIPAGGYKTFIIKAIYDLEISQEYETDIRVGNEYIENKYYKIIVEEDRGTVTIMDKLNHKIFKNCHRLVDGGDTGDEYTYSPPLNDQIVVSHLNTISTRDVGPAEATLNIAGKMILPVGLKSDRKSRSDMKVECYIDSEIKLYSEIQRIEFKTKFDNKACDHRLRVEFPTNIKTNNVYAEGHFDVVKRLIKFPDSEGWVEKSYKTTHNSGFIDINDGEYGIALLNQGLPEYEILPENNTITLTLVRSVGWLSRDDLEYRKVGAGPSLPTPEAQCLGQHTFFYALIPHQGNWDDARIPQRTRQYKTKVLTKQLKNQQGNLPDRYSFMELEGKNLVISAFKKHECEDKLVIRVYNPTEKNITEKIKFGFNIRKIFLGRLDERYDKELLYGDGVRITLKPKEIKTIILEVLFE